MPVLCVVCHAKTDGRKRNRIIACEACKSFFLVHCRNPEELTCKTGSFQCQARDDLPGTCSKFVTNEGVIWRFACSRCRYKKCLDSGMWTSSAKVFENYQLAMKKSHLTKPTTLHMFQNDNSNWEGNVQMFGKGFQELFYKFDKFLPGRINHCTTMTDVLSCQLDNFTTTAGWLASFLKTIPEYSNIPVKDRVKFFANGYPITNFLLCLLFNQTLGMTEANFNILLQVIPRFGYHVPENKEISKFLCNFLTPSHVELGYIIAVMFFKNNPLQQTSQSLSVTDTVTNTLIFYLNKRYAGDEEKVKKRLQMLDQAIELLLEKGRIRLAVQMREMHKFHSSKLMEEMANSFETILATTKVAYK